MVTLQLPSLCRLKMIWSSWLSSAWAPLVWPWFRLQHEPDWCLPDFCAGKRFMNKEWTTPLRQLIKGICKDTYLEIVCCGHIESYWIYCLGFWLQSFFLCTLFPSHCEHTNTAAFLSKEYALEMTKPEVNIAKCSFNYSDRSWEQTSFQRLSFVVFVVCAPHGVLGAPWVWPQWGQQSALKSHKAPIASDS